MLPPTKNENFKEENVIMPYTCRRPFFLEEELLSSKENTMKDTIRQTRHNNLKRKNVM